MFNFWQIAKKSINLYLRMTALFIMKFDLDRIKTVGGVAFGDVHPHMVLC